MNIPNFSKIYYKKFKYIISLIIIFLSLTSSNTSASTLKGNTLDFNITYKEILILSSKSNNVLLENELFSYISERFSSDSSIRIYTEALASELNDQVYMDKEADLLLMKYSKNKFNLILCLDDEAAVFIAKYYDTLLLNNTPVVYCGVNDIAQINEYPYNFFTGILESPNPRLLIDIIIRAHPKAKTINILLDNTIASNEIEKQLKDIAPYYNSKINFNYIKSDYIEDISSMLNYMSKTSPTVLVGSFKNSSNTLISPVDTISFLKASNAGPLYTLNYSYLGKGVIGGYLLSLENHGKLLYQVASRILKGDSIHSISSILDINYAFIFDLKETINNGIDRKELPKSSIYINENWLHQKFSAVVVLILIFIVFLSFGLMLFFAFKKNENEKKANLVKACYDEAVVNDKIKTEFIANFSHEIRTLLNVMLSSIQLLDIYKDNGKLIFTDENDAVKLSYVRKSGFRLLKLINNLIDISKLDSGFYHTEFEIKNIVDVIEDITMSVVEYAKAKDIDIIFDTNEEEFFMPLDIEKLDRIVLNLLSNSIKFTPNGGMIYVNLHCEATSVSISIKDTGVGISKDDQALIFNRFIQASNTNFSGTTGSGIGLSLVKSLIELLNGSITLKSELNNGSEFIVTLPVKASDEITSSTTYVTDTKLTNNSDKIKIEFSDINL